MPVRQSRLPLLGGVVLASLLALVVAATIIWMLVRPSETTFNIVAETERVTMELSEQVPWRWNLRDVKLREADLEESSFTGAIQLGKPVDVTMERVASGSLWIHVTHPPARSTGTCEAATKFVHDEPTGHTACEFDIFIRDIAERAGRGITTILTLEGDVSVGRPVGFETQGSGSAVLRSGRVTLRERSIFGQNVYEAGSVDLETGDFFQVERSSGSEQSRGFIVIDERPGMTAAFRAVGRKAVVGRPGGGEYPVTSRLFQRLLNDVGIQVLSALLAALVGIVGFAASVIELRSVWRT
jgi:hypothetical protein